MTFNPVEAQQHINEARASGDKWRYGEVPRMVLDLASDLESAVEYIAGLEKDIAFEQSVTHTVRLRAESAEAEVARLKSLVGDTGIEWGYRHAQGVTPSRTRADAELGVEEVKRRDLSRQKIAQGFGAVMQRRKASEWVLAPAPTERG